MSNDFLTPINSEQDLDHYAEYLKREFPSVSLPDTIQNCLYYYVGKTIKIDLFSLYRTDSKTGILKQIGQDFILIQTPQQRDVLIPVHMIKSITVLQNDKKLPHF